jgi:hypothetical protein
MRLDYSDTKIIQIFIVTNRFSHFLLRCTKYFKIQKIKKNILALLIAI